MAKTEEKQVEDSEEQSEETSEELETLSEEETVEKVSELLDEQVEESEEETEEETEEEAEEEETPIPLIDDEFIKKYPATKAYYGKPVTELGHSYQSIVKEFNENRREISELKKKLAEASIPKLEDEPDPIEQPEEHKKWTKEREEAIRADERNKIGTPQPQVDYVAEVAKRLPDDVDVNKVIDSWEKANAYKLYDNFGNLIPEMQLLYQNKPHVLYQEIVDYYNLVSKADKTEEEIRKAGHKKAQNDFKKARKEKKNIPKADVHVVERETKVSEKDRMLSNIYKIVQEE